MSIIHKTKITNFIKYLTMYKNTIIVLIASFLSLLITEKSNAQCPPNGLELYTQSDVDDFATQYPNCTEVPIIYISSAGQSSFEAINNLDGLSNLTSVEGDFNIISTNITNLNGLSNLISVGGNFGLFNNNSLSNIEGLGDLIIVEG